MLASFLLLEGVAGRFIVLMIRESFDYTKWQRDLYEDMSVDELFCAASDWKKVDSENA